MNQQYNHDPFETMLKYAGNRDVLDRFEERSVRLSVEAALATVSHYDHLLKQLEANLVRQATLHDPRACSLLRTIPGIGKITRSSRSLTLHRPPRHTHSGPNQKASQQSQKKPDQIPYAPLTAEAK